MNDVQRGKRLKELREAKGLLGRQVGAIFDIDKSAVSEWETGKSAPDRRKLVKLDELYDARGEVLALYDVAPASGGFTAEDFRLLDERYPTLQMAYDALQRLDQLAERVTQLEDAVGGQDGTPHPVSGR